MDALGINLGYLIMQFLLFTILYLVLRGYLYNPILKVLEDRKERIAKGLEDARQAAVARDNADAEAKKILDAARAEAAKIRSDAVVAAEESAKGITAKANEDAQTIKTQAAAAAEEERNNILAELRGQVVAIAMAAANRIVGETLDEKRQHAILADFFAKVPESVSGLSGDAAEVVSALPLTADEKAKVQKAVKAGTVSYRVDPTILGGLVVRVGDQVIDSSVAGQMSALRESIR